MKYFMLCKVCKKATFNLSKEEANGPCPKCGGPPAIVDRM